MTKESSVKVFQSYEWHPKRFFFFVLFCFPSTCARCLLASFDVNKYLNIFVSCSLREFLAFYGEIGAEFCGSFHRCTSPLPKRKKISAGMM